MTAPISRVAILGPAPPDRGGIARETSLLARELSRRTSVFWFTFSRAYPKWLDPRRFAEDERFGRSPAVPILDWRSPVSWRRAAEEIARSGMEALVVPWWTAFWALPVRAVLRRLERRRPGLPRVLICHNVEDHEGSALLRFLSLGAFLAADGCLVHSEFAARSLARRVAAKPVSVAPLPVCEIAPPGREEARRKLGIDRPLVLFLGLVRRYKGVDTLLAAAPAIVRETGARVAIVGESFPDAREIERLCRESPARADILRRDEYVSEEEMGEWLAACDVLVLPYRKISGSAMAARALAARRPIAAAAVGSLAETVVAGVTGELFAPGDAGSLARAVSTILSRGLAPYHAGLVEAARRASWENYAETLLRFLAELKGR